MPNIWHLPHLLWVLLDLKFATTKTQPYTVTKLKIKKQKTHNNIATILEPTT